MSGINKDNNKYLIKRLRLKNNLYVKLKKAFKDCSDVVIQKIENKQDINIHAIYVNNMINTDIVDLNILLPLVENITNINTVEDAQKLCKTKRFHHVQSKVLTKKEEIINAVMEGEYAIVFDNVAILFDARKYEKRAVGEAANEVSVKGAKDAFIEIISSNVALIRKRVKTPRLKTLMFEIGNTVKTKVIVMYIDNLVDEKKLKEVKERINSISIASLNSPAIFEENFFMEPRVFPRMVYTERPDKFAANITDGRIGILIDGFPLGYILPGLLTMQMQDPEDYSTSRYIASFKRMLRYLALAISLILPSFYVAITTFHPEMLPTKLIVSIVNSKQDVPLPLYVELLVMLIAFEMLLEAGARLPKNLGQAISILGGLIVGEAAVNAKFVSPAVIVIVATVGITGFLIPNQDLSNAIRLCRFGLIIMSAIAGLFGLSIGLLLVLYYLSSMEVLGDSYLKPYTEYNYKNMIADTFIRGNLKKHNKNRW